MKTKVFVSLIVIVTISVSCSGGYPFDTSLYGERWFCTESEARANGWRKAKN